MLLPAAGVVERPRGEGGTLRALLDVAGGIVFVLFVSFVVIALARGAFVGGSWTGVIGWESVWLIAAMLCAPLMPSGIHHVVSWRSTIEGLALSWPQLVYGTIVFASFAAYVGGVRLLPGPLGLALAVGVAEEFIFRVLLLGWLVSKLPAPQALAVSSCVFGLAHLHALSLLGVISVTPQIGCGFVFGAVYLRTRNPLGSILVHAFWDYPYFMALGIGVSGGGTGAGMPPLLQLAPWLAFMVYGLWLVRFGVPLTGRIEPIGSTGHVRTP
jgi:membrane protease YdiL (CAAX protease family)